VQGAPAVVLAPQEGASGRRLRSDTIRRMSEQQPVAYQPVIVQPVTTARNGFGIAALILSLFGIVFGGIPLIGLFLVFLPVLLAITFGILGLVKASKANVGFGISLAGLIVAGITFLLWFVGYGLLW
jgi:hypothetical protein